MGERVNIKKILLTFCFLLFTPSAYASEVTVSAASSLTHVFGELQEVFMAENPDITIYINFASSQYLLKQIREGAPVDIFASADQLTMDEAENSQLIDNGTRQNFARNSLVLVIPFESSNIPTSLKDLISKTFERIAIGNINSVPVGRYTKESLVSEKIWNALKNRLIYGEHARQVLAYVVRGEVDAGFVFATDALEQRSKVKIALTMEGHQHILYPIALVKNTKNKDDSQKFLDFIFSDKGAKILARYGFKQPCYL